MIQKLLLSIIVVCVAMAGWFYSVPPQMAYSQGETKVTCGQILEGEFTKDIQEHRYILTMEPRWRFNVSVEPFGDLLETVISLQGPTGITIGFTDGLRPNMSWAGLQKTPSIESGILSARGQYTIRVVNTPISGDKLLDNPTYFGGIGLYNLSIGCTTSDGSKILPGDNPLPTSVPQPTATVSSTLPETPPAFTGIGFPGLPPVDFTSAITSPLPLGESVTGIMPLDEQILAFTLDAEKDDTLDLSYTRSSGNMNLGMVVLSESNNVIFQASLVTSESLSTRFILPEAGEYTIGVFRISLVEPAQAKPTLFKIKGVLNPTE